MKEFKVSMTRRVSELALIPIRDKSQVVILLLEAVALLIYGELTDRQPSGDFIILRVDKMKRLIFVLDRKIFSFNFPFAVGVIDEEKNPIVYDPDTDFEMDGKNFAVLRALVEEIFNDDDNMAILDLDSDLMRIMESFEIASNKDAIWQIIKKLARFESGYLRYDYDEAHQNGRLHPLNHLDINYSSDATFKLGINDVIDDVTFIDILDVNTNSYFISD